MRGIFVECLEGLNCPRFNPAYAGNMFRIADRRKDFQVQPRVCGEYVMVPVVVLSVLGSTPRMRGISKSDATTNKSFRFNPAYARNILTL